MKLTANQLVFPACTAHSHLFVKRSEPVKLVRAFTLIELILVMTLLVVVTSLTLPTMSRFIRGRALGTEAQRFLALAHAAQSRAVSEGMPMMLWVNAKTGSYGVSAETTTQGGDPKAESVNVDSTLQIAVVNNGPVSSVTFNSLPAIRFQPDGTIDEDSPQTLQLIDADGFMRWLVEASNHTGYEIFDHRPQ